MLSIVVPSMYRGLHFHRAYVIERLNLLLVKRLSSKSLNLYWSCKHQNFTESSMGVLLTPSILEKWWPYGSWSVTYTFYGRGWDRVGKFFFQFLLNLFRHLRYRQNTLHYTKLLIEQYLSSHHVSNDTVYDHNDNNVVILAKHFLLIDASSILVAFLYFTKGWLWQGVV